MSTTTPAAGSFPPSSNQPSFQPSLVAQGTVAIRPKSKTALAGDYGVHRTTMGKMCRDIGIVSSKKLTIKQIMAIYQAYDYPGDYNVVLNIGQA